MKTNTNYALQHAGTQAAALSIAARFGRSTRQGFLMLACAGVMAGSGDPSAPAPAPAPLPAPSPEPGPLPSPTPAPATVGQGAGDARVSAGLTYSLVVRQNGEVVYWGSEMIGATAKSGIPGSPASVLTGLSGITALATGRGHVALGANRQAFAWGSAGNGAFGDWWSDVVDVPVSVPQFGASTQAASIDCTDQARVWLSLHEDGSVWSVPGTVEPGSGVQPGPITARRIDGLPPIRSLGNGECATAIAADGALFTLTSRMTSRNTPTFAYEFNITANQMVGLPPVIDASCNDTRCFVAGRDGTVWAWGRNDSGELGDGTTTLRLVPVQVPGLAQIARVFTTELGVTFAIDAGGRAYSWGGAASDYILMGRGWDANDPAFRQTPRMIGGVPLPIVSFSANQHAIAMLSDGTVWTWGHGGYGQLGDGTTNSSDQPIRVLDTAMPTAQR